MMQLVFERLLRKAYFGGRTILPYELTKGNFKRTSVAIVSNSPVTTLIVIRPSHVALIPTDIKVLSYSDSII